MAAVPPSNIKLVIKRRQLYPVLNSKETTAKYNKQLNIRSFKCDILTHFLSTITCYSTENRPQHFYKQKNVKCSCSHKLDQKKLYLLVFQRCFVLHCKLLESKRYEKLQNG